MIRHIALGLAALALAVPLPAFAQGGGAAPRAQIEKMDQAWEDAFNAGDAAALTALYTTDAQVMPPNKETASGSKAIQALYTAEVGQGVKNTLTTKDVVGFGDYAVATGGWVANSDEGKHVDHGTYMTLYKKVDGGWKIHRDTWNSSMARK